MGTKKAGCMVHPADVINCLHHSSHRQWGKTIRSKRSCKRTFSARRPSSTPIAKHHPHNTIVAPMMINMVHVLQKMGCGWHSRNPVDVVNPNYRLAKALIALSITSSVMGLLLYVGAFAADTSSTNPLLLVLKAGLLHCGRSAE